jgi:pyruvate, water dikinase
MSKSSKFILFFNSINNKDVPLVGGKNASLGEMYSKLTTKGVRVPNGFAVTSKGYWHFIKDAGIEKGMKEILKGLDTHNMANLRSRGRKVRELILRSDLPKDLEGKIIEAYKKLGKGRDIAVAVRSSATAEDLPDASFAGQQDTYLNIEGGEELLESVKRCISSLFTDRAISYREDKHFSHMKIALSVTVQEMVRADKAASGVMFTIDTESGFKDTILINSIYGLGENIVQGRVNPDEFIVFKPLLKKGFPALISKDLGRKKLRMVYNKKKNVTNIDVPAKDRIKYSITDKEVLELARWGAIIEDHYKKPMDIEWAKDGVNGKLYIVQARPETVRSQENKNVLEEYILTSRPSTDLVLGVGVGKKIGSGKARIILDVAQINQFKKGEVLVTDMTNPDWEPIMKIASAIVTDSGGRTCHAAIVARELGIPALVGSAVATKNIKTGDKITVDCSSGDRGYVYKGLVPFTIKKTNIGKLPKLKTQIMMNIGEPSQAYMQANIPNQGVGLARLEFIINEYIKVHPLALLAKPTKKIAEILKNAGYKNGKDFFVDQLTEGIARLGSAFYPKDVIVRMSDFKSNEYAHLVGGEAYEPDEQNPMLGWRGASRYYDPNFREAFDMECEAFRRVRDDLGLTNVKIMIPFVRTIEEAKKVLAVMEKNGLKRKKNGLQIYMMVEIPSNIILAEEFAKLFDGFSIGSNDLTQLTLGVDRDSALVAHVYDERNEAVKSLIKQVIAVAKKTKTKVGICGQGPSDYPEFAEFLVGEGIDSISLTPDTVIESMLRIGKLEKKKKRK